MSMGMVTGITTGRPRNLVSITGRGMRFLVFQSVQNDSEAHTPILSEYRQLSTVGKSGRRVMLLASSQMYEGIHQLPHRPSRGIKRQIYHNIEVVQYKSNDLAQ
jgi:hypothetical protein